MPRAPLLDMVPDFWFRVWVLDFRFSVFGFRVPGFGFQVPGSGIRDLDFGFQDPGSRLLRVLTATY